MPRAGKRGRGKGASSPAQKKQRRDPLLEAVIEGISQSKDLTEGATALLTAVAPNCLLTPRSDRHAAQVTVVSWIEKVLDDVREQLQEGYDATTRDQGQYDEQQDELQKMVSDTQAAASAASQVVHNCEVRLSVAKQAVVAAKSRLAESEEAQTVGDKKLVEVEKEKETLEKSLQESFAFLRKDEGFEVDRANAYINDLWDAAKGLGLDESLVVAVPTAAEKQPNKRGAFDNAVLDQLEAILEKRVEQFAKELAQAEQGKEERAAHAARAKADVVDAEEVQLKASEAIAAANKAKEAAESNRADAESKLDHFVRSRSEARSVREGKKAALTNFASYTLASFLKLRDLAPAQDPLAEGNGATAPTDKAPEAVPAAAAGETTAEGVEA